MGNKHDLQVGVIGAGQLGRMLAIAGIPLGVRCRFFDPADGAPVQGLGRHVRAPYEAQDKMRAFALGCRVVTYEVETIPLETAVTAESTSVLMPTSRVLSVTQDRLKEKQLARSLGIPTARWTPVNGVSDIETACEQCGLPLVLKRRFGGYDGRGQIIAYGLSELKDAVQQLGPRDLIAEGLLNFDRELSILAVRSPSGERRTYSLVENHHVSGILRVSLAPAANVTGHLRSQAEQIAALLMDDLNYAGVIAVELFQVGDTLILNEIAPRVHNSGHWTIEGAHTSQFENHLRAILDLPLGATDALAPSGMVNLIGSAPPLRDLLSLPASVHLYDKEPRPGRKLGHVTFTGIAAHEDARRYAQELVASTG